MSSLDSVIEGGGVSRRIPLYIYVCTWHVARGDGARLSLHDLSVFNTLAARYEFLPRPPEERVGYSEKNGYILVSPVPEI